MPVPITVFAPPADRAYPAVNTADGMVAFARESTSSAQGSGGVGRPRLRLRLELELERVDDSQDSVERAPCLSVQPSLFLLSRRARSHRVKAQEADYPTPFQTTRRSRQ
jgi:hypothetical protein